MRKYGNFGAKKGNFQANTKYVDGNYFWMKYDYFFDIPIPWSIGDWRIWIKTRSKRSLQLDIWSAFWIYKKIVFFGISLSHTKRYFLDLCSLIKLIK